jgi:peptide/nickel transport system substrate-binding protein
VRWRRTSTVLAGAVALAVTLAGCGNPDKRDGAPDAAAGMVANLNGGNMGGGDNPQKNYNPFLVATKLNTDYVFETLFQINRYNCDPVPWLATSFSWSDPKNLTMTTREGVTFTDGKPFSAKDVAFTFNLIKKVPSFDIGGVWSALSSVTATDDKTVKFAFKQPAAEQFTKLNDVFIVPEHIWAGVADPGKFLNEDGIGTGPYKYKSFNRQQLVLERNPDYWQADKIKVQQLTFTPNGGGGDTDKLRLARGDYDFNGMFIADIDKTYVSKDPQHNKYWFPAGADISLYLNLTKAPFDDLAFRKALAVSVNREEISKKAQYGYVQPASQTGLLLPGQKDWLNPEYADGAVLGFDPEDAKKQFQAAGYRYDGDKLLGKDGKPMSFTFQVQAGYLDWIAAANILRANVGQVGINLEVRTAAPTEVENNRAIGSYDMVFGVHGGTCNMFQNFDDPLGSDRTAAIGKPAVSNFVRWNDPATDRLLTQLRGVTDEAQQKAVVHQLQTVFVEQLPTIPLWYGAKWYQYRTENAVGWPSSQDPYAPPDNPLLIITRLTPPS